MKTPHEQTIRAHCEQHNIAIKVLPSGALRFTGYGVAITVANVAGVTLANLAPHAPVSRQDLRNDWPSYERKADRGHRQ